MEKAGGPCHAICTACVAWAASPPTGDEKENEDKRMDASLKEKKIAVVGVGGVGGYLAGMLAKSFPHVTVAAHGKRGGQLMRKGIVLHSDYHGEIRVKPQKVVIDASLLGEQEIIFVCVKNYSLEEACLELKDAVSENTILVPVMNGVNKADVMRGLVGKGTVVDAVIYIIAYMNPDGSVRQMGDLANLLIGMENPSFEDREKVREVEEILASAGIDSRISDDIRRDVWGKYILNCAYNVETAAYDNTIGALRKDPDKAKEYEALVNEAYNVSLAEGVDTDPEFPGEVIARFYNDYPDGATSSLQRDFEAGKRSELDVFSAFLVREGNRLGVPVPVSEKMYRLLLRKEQERRKAAGNM